MTFHSSCAIKSLAFQHPMKEQKTVCYTLDLEQDYAGIAPLETYEALSDKESLERLSKIIQRFELKLTVFATGKVLDQKKEIVDFFLKMGAEVELHGYHHVMYQPNLTLELKKGVESYQRHFGQSPSGYRSPGGVISPILLKSLADEGIQYDSSLIPSFRKGVYKNLKSPIKPFQHLQFPIVELPVGVVPKIRLPVAASYIRLLGLTTYKFLFAIFGSLSPLVYFFHLVDLIPTQTRKQLSPFWRFIYAKGQRRGFSSFEASVKYFQNLGYKPDYMSRLHKMYSRIDKPSFDRGHQANHK